MLSTSDQSRPFQERTNLVKSTMHKLMRKNAANTKATSTQDGDRYKTGEVAEANTISLGVSQTMPYPLGQEPIRSSPPVDEPLSTVSIVTSDPSKLAALQIHLLQKVIGVVKVHASEAATNLVRLRSLMSMQDDTQSVEYKALGRERWLEERRELDAKKALWAACQRVEAIVSEDSVFFEEERRTGLRRQQWHELQRDADLKESNRSMFADEEHASTGFYDFSKYRRRRRADAPVSLPVPSPSQHVSTAVDMPTVVPLIDHRSRLIPLSLAHKVDPTTLERKTNRVSSTSSSSSGCRSSGSSAASELRTPLTFAQTLEPVYHDEEVDDDGTSGTVTIFRSSAADGITRRVMNGAGGQTGLTATAPDAEKRVEDDMVQVKMPDYAADLMSDFDAQSTGLTLALVSPTYSSTDDLASPKSARSSIISPLSAPSSPSRTRRQLHKVPSKRFSGFFVKHQPSLSSLSQSPYMPHSTQIPSRLGSSIDLVIPEDRPFSLDFNLERLGLESRNYHPLSTDHDHLTASTLDAKRFSDPLSGSAVSLLSGFNPEPTTATSAIPDSPPPSTSSSGPNEGISPPQSAASAETPTPNTQSDHKFAAKLRKRISALRF